MARTKFYSIHEALGAKIIDFAGYDMPVQYSSMIKEHMAVRNSVGVFDVSHMGEFFVTGPEALKLVDYITTNNPAKLEQGQVQYSAMCYEDGGIVDDLLVYKFDDTKFMLVVNASNKEKDLDWINKHNKFDAKVTDDSDEYSLIAVQGPNSAKVITKLCSKELDIEYYRFFTDSINGAEVIVSRTGYTGELGYELYFKSDEETALNIWNDVFEAGKEFDIEPAGLGARDTLRLEMGMALYGNDIDKDTNTIEAGLKWITKLKKGEFVGRDALVKVNEAGPSRKLVGIELNEKAFPRSGYPVVKNGEEVGVITSGTVSPVMEKPIAMAYLRTDTAVLGNEVAVKIRKKEFTGTIVKFPFLKK